MKKLTFLIVLTFIIQNTVSSQPCLPEGITFTTQAEIDNFQTNHPNCTEIEGDVTITGSDITNLSGLNVLTAFGGSLLIGNYYSGNPILTSLIGLENVTFIGGHLWIKYNDTLTSLSGLDNITSIGGNLNIYENDAMTSLTGLENVTSIGGHLWIKYNNALTGLSGLDNVTSIWGYLSIKNNAAMTSLTGLDNVTFIGEYLWIEYNAALSSLAGLNNVTSIGGNLYIVFNSALTSLTGLDNVASIGGRLRISANGALTSLTGLENVTYIVGKLLINYNTALINLAGLDNVTSIGGGFDIFSNNALTSLTALDNVTSIGGNLSIVGNNGLTSLTGLNNIYAGSISNLDIYHNSSLSTCEVQSICDYLASPNGYIYINDNALGCNSQAQVEEACEALWIPSINIESGFSIYPNPAKKEIFISVKNGTIINEVNIYNQIGQKLLHKKRITNKINVSKLRQGMYIIELITNDLRIREKLIIR